MQSMLQNAKFLQQSQMSNWKIWHVQKKLENFAQGCTSVEPGLTDWDRTQRMIENLFYIQYIYIYIYIYVYHSLILTCIHKQDLYSESQASKVLVAYKWLALSGLFRWYSANDWKLVLYSIIHITNQSFQ